MIENLKPYLSVIIPTRNRASLLEKTIESIALQTYPSHLFELIVVDNGSTDSTGKVCRSFEQLFENFTYLFESKPGLHSGRHIGCKASQGEILVYGDDDIRAFPTWLEGVSESFQELSVTLVGGKILPKFESEPPEWFANLWGVTPWGKSLGYYSLIDFGDEVKEISPLYVYGCNFSIRKQVLLDFGGFHPDSVPKELLRFRGDGETAVSQAIDKKGYKTIYNPKASVYHWVSTEKMTYDYLYKRAFAQGISDSYTRIRNNGFPSESQQYNSGAGEVNKIIHKGYYDGFDFHQKSVFKDPDLLKWITKSNYIDD